jgi:ABC-type Fe3+ transport system permease subunit
MTDAGQKVDIMSPGQFDGSLQEGRLAAARMLLLLLLLLLVLVLVLVLLLTWQRQKFHKRCRIGLLAAPWQQQQQQQQGPCGASGPACCCCCCLLLLPLPLLLLDASVQQLVPLVRFLNPVCWKDCAHFLEH